MSTVPTLLDASAVIAFLAEEPGHERVAQALHDAHCIVTAANQAEIIAKLLDRGMEPDDIRAVLTELNYVVVDITAEDGAQAGYLRRQTRALGLSLGDRLCLAVAARLQSPVLTADRPWLSVAGPLGLSVQCLRPGAH